MFYYLFKISVSEMIKIFNNDYLILSVSERTLKDSYTN